MDPNMMLVFICTCVTPEKKGHTPQNEDITSDFFFSKVKLPSSCDKAV